VCCNRRGTPIAICRRDTPYFIKEKFWWPVLQLVVSEWNELLVSAMSCNRRDTPIAICRRDTPYFIKEKFWWPVLQVVVSECNEWLQWVVIECNVLQWLCCNKKDTHISICRRDTPYFIKEKLWWPVLQLVVSECNEWLQWVVSEYNVPQWVSAMCCNECVAICLNIIIQTYCNMHIA
jgi:hypothetical protein